MATHPPLAADPTPTYAQWQPSLAKLLITLTSRGLEYTGHFLLNLLGSVLKGGPDAGDTSKEDYLRAYEAVLEPHHPWIVRKAVHVRGWRKETYILH